MAVQAQHPSGFAFSPDFRSRGGSYVIEDFQMLQDQGNTVGLYGGHLGGINNATVFSDPQSELTCNASGKRKRPLEEPPMVMPQPNPDYVSNLASVLSPICYPDIAASATGCPQSRLLESAGTSTSGRTASPLTLNLVSQIFHHSVEIDSLIRLQNERLQNGVEEARKRYFKALLWGMEQRAAKRLREKEAELEKARRKNAELEERVRQVATESEMWFTVARNNESIAASLRADLEQVLLCNAAAAQVKEGYGDTDDDAQSCRSVEVTGRKSTAPAPAPAPTDEVRRWPRAACRSCAEGDVCVLLLPCKHLCLCKSCESKTHVCPCCGTVKNACLQIFMP
ncbi:protein binding zinc ion binding [Musa troglodytarum]|uniref:Protein binding zinc ion binding n=1 Tax=Musa troglodytarum TaxID=320322 RepID=A0A9E7GFX0_9LILI|nr:protein binding zinc ion binding [Musa troglodytarum]